MTFTLWIKVSTPTFFIYFLYLCLYFCVYESRLHCSVLIQLHKQQPADAFLLYPGTRRQQHVDVWTMCCNWFSFFLRLIFNLKLLCVLILAQSASLGISVSEPPRAPCKTTPTLTDFYWESLYGFISWLANRSFLLITMWNRQTENRYDQAGVQVDEQEHKPAPRLLGGQQETWL